MQDSTKPEVAPHSSTPLGATPLAWGSAARKRAWTEPRVRLWWLMSVGILLLMLYLVAAHTATWWAERQVVMNGVPVEAVIVRARNDLNDITLPDKNMPSDSECTLEFTLNGKKYTVIGQLAEHMERVPTITTGPDHPVTLRVNPDRPDEQWTDRTAAPPFFSRRLLGAAIGTPIALLLLLIAAVKRRGVMRVLQTGRQIDALVVDTRQTPIAPRSQAVRCTPADTNDKRVFTVYLPAGAGKASKGSTVSVIRPADAPEPAYAVAWFDREHRGEAIA